MDKLTDAQQESYLAQGLALGVLAVGVNALPADKVEFEVSHAWRRFASRSRFPRVGQTHAADLYYAVIRRSARRQGPMTAAWGETGPQLYPCVRSDGQDVEESGQVLANWSGVPCSHWQQLGRDLVDYYREYDLPPAD